VHWTDGNWNALTDACGTDASTCDRERVLPDSSLTRGALRWCRADLAQARGDLVPSNSRKETSMKELTDQSRVHRVERHTQYSTLRHALSW